MVFFVKTFYDLFLWDAVGVNEKMLTFVRIRECPGSDI